MTYKVANKTCCRGRYRSIVIKYFTPQVKIKNSLIIEQVAAISCFRSNYYTVSVAEWVKQQHAATEGLSSSPADIGFVSDFRCCVTGCE